MLYAIFQINVGDNYEPDMRMQFVGGETREELAQKIPDGVPYVLIVNSPPVWHKVGKCVILTETKEVID